MNIKLNTIEYLANLGAFEVEFFVEGYEREFKTYIENKKLTLLSGYRTKAEEERIAFKIGDHYWDLLTEIYDEIKVETYKLYEQEEALIKALLEAIDKDPVHSVHLRSLNN